jgi:hypothetical protein
MKKVVLLSLILLSGILLAACGKKYEELIQNIEPTKIIEDNDCIKIIEDYVGFAKKE